MMTAQEIVQYLECELDVNIEMWKYCEERGHRDALKYAVTVYTIEGILEAIDPPE